ncbi:hypothetical protein CP973_22715 [Streptomyces albofaciens JCM 4342]|uniref:DUF5988 family protein n=1 Tax=Streptomyces albofaciens TaxID=66866 RepID=UPI000A7602C8|nr:DUF5988 family protein [Streptomyces albofaciens]KAA6215169.1 hypothetical protein CP973_22715 [Streptomyces albofaciens JCM 4342]
MPDSLPPTPQQTVTEALLDGGPRGIPSRQALPSTGTLEDLKIPHLNGYEHYTFTGTRRTVDGCLLPVFRWTHTTYIAE